MNKKPNTKINMRLAKRISKSLQLSSSICSMFEAANPNNDNIYSTEFDDALERAMRAIKQGANINSTGTGKQTIGHALAYKIMNIDSQNALDYEKYCDALVTCIDKGLDVNAKNEDGLTLLAYLEYAEPVYNVNFVSAKAIMTSTHAKIEEPKTK